MKTRPHLLPLLLLVLAAAAVYGQVVGVWYCGYDDFAENHRAAFEDSADPAGILTKTHFNTAKYRPLHRGMSWLTWRLSGGSPVLFRVRNIAFHVVVAAAVYGIVFLLVRSRAPAAAAGLLFTVHPLVNQSVVVASWAVTAAYALLFVAFLLFLVSLEGPRPRVGPLAGSLAIVFSGLFMYEPVITVFGLMYGYAFIHRFVRGRRLDRAWVLTLLAGTGAVVAAYAAMRAIFVSQPMPVTPLPLLVKNLVMYLAALALPVDLVFAHFLFGTPLPSQLRLTPALLGAALAGIVVAVAGAGLLVWRSAVLRARLRTVEWPEVLLFAAGIPMLLSPYLIFSGHPSETYLYSPVGMFAVILTLLLWRLTAGGRAFYAVCAVLLLVYSAYGLLRTARVAACADTAGRIIAQLPTAEWRSGAHRVILADAPGTPPLNRFGIYGYHGLGTIDPREPGMKPAQQAVQTVTGNPQIAVDVVGTAEMDSACRPPAQCFWVGAGGEVRRVAGAPGGAR